MRDNVEPVFGWPNIVRFSWGPATEVLEKCARRLKSQARACGGYLAAPVISQEIAIPGLAS